MSIPRTGIEGDFVTLVVTHQIKQRSDFGREGTCTHAIGEMEGGTLMCVNVHIVNNDTHSKKDPIKVAQIRLPSIMNK